MSVPKFGSIFRRQQHTLHGLARSAAGTLDAKTASLDPVFTMTMLVIGGRESSAISIFFAAIFNLMFPRIGIGFA
jgi:hypothetical protein